MSSRVNAREGIERTARDHGWLRIVGDVDGEIWARGTDRVAITYKLFGSGGSMRLCKYYGKDPMDGVNYGVDTAAHGDEMITGRNKRGQILAILKAAP